MPLPGDKIQQKKIVDTRNAIESYVCLCTIATGILSIIAFSHNREIWKRYPGWIRTIRSTIPTIAIIKETLAQDIPVFLELYPHVPFCSIINARRRPVDFLFDDLAC